MFKCWWDRRRRRTNTSGRYVRFTRVDPDAGHAAHAALPPASPQARRPRTLSLSTVACGARSAVSVVAPGLELVDPPHAAAHPAAHTAYATTPVIVVDDTTVDDAQGPDAEPGSSMPLSEDDDDEVVFRRHEDDYRRHRAARTTCKYPRRRRGRPAPPPTSGSIPSIRVSPRPGALHSPASTSPRSTLSPSSRRTSPLPGTSERGILTRVRKKSYPFEDGDDEVFFIRENEDAEPEAIKVQLFDVEVVTVTAIPQPDAGGEQGAGNTLYIVDGYPSSNDGYEGTDHEGSDHEGEHGQGSGGEGGGFRNSAYVDDSNDSDNGERQAPATKHVQFSEWMEHEKDIPDIDGGDDDESDRDGDGLNDPGGGPGGGRGRGSPTGGLAGLSYPLSPQGLHGPLSPGHLGETRLELGPYDGLEHPAEQPRKSNMFLDKPRMPEKNVKRHSIHGMMEEENVVRPHQEMKQLSLDEKKFLLAVERGDVASTRRMLQRAQETCHMNVNCVDPLGRSALLMAIDNENLEMVELLLEYRVETKDALLHAISEQFVEAVEVLLDQEEAVHRHGELHSWEALPSDTATFTPDITPLILAAHRDNYEIIKILLDRGSTLPMPHDVRCGCDECVTSRQEDSLRHSRSRINAYRALASPSLIALSSKDPILTAFELSWELRRLSFLEHEFKTEYQELRKQCQDFATALLDHTRSSYELEVLLNHDPTGPAFEHGERMHLNRLKLAIKLRQKKFVAHPNVQQLLASIWYEGLPGFRRKNMVLQAFEIVRIGAMFPFFSTVYVVGPHSSVGQTLRKPFIKFLCHAASYFTFLFLLILASQRIESVIAEWIFGADPISSNEINDLTTKRGAPPSVVECFILAWVLGLIWSEVKQLWDVGLEEYANDMWNVIDFVTNSLYVATVALRVVAYYRVQKEKEMHIADSPREQWDTWDPMLISEGLFSAANIFSSLKLVYIFSVNPYLGPLQVSLSRMVMDIMKFFFLYVLVLFAFSCGLNQLLWYYADMEKQICNKNQPTQQNGQGNSTHPPDRDACVVWRRFANLFETTQTLFWAVFGLVDLDNFELAGIKSFTRFWGMLMFGTYSVINIVVLLNLLIATMNHSYQLISERADTEWKFARSKLWISYFEEGGTVPPPFNVIPTPKSIFYICRWVHRKLCGHSRAAKKEHMRTIRRKVKQASERDFRYQSIMRNLVRRYVTVEQRKAESQGVTEDDVNEIKQDISAFRCELIEILKNSGMNTHTSSSTGAGSGGKKNRQKERRLMKGFNIAPPPSSSGGQNLSPVVEMAITSDVSDEPICASADNGAGGGGGSGPVGAIGALAGPELFGSTISGVLGVGRRGSQHGQHGSSSEGHHGLGRLAPRLNLSKSRPGGSHKRRWGTLIEAAKSGRVGRLISRSRSEDSVCNGSRQRGHPHQHRSNSEEATDTDSAEGLGLGHPLASAMAALRRKRHKFSASRGSQAVQTTSHNDSDDVALHGLGGSLQGPSTSQQALASTSAASKKALQRASSVPARTPEEVSESRPRPRPHRQQLQEAEARVIEHLHQLQLHQQEHLALAPTAAEEAVSRDALLLSEAAGGVVVTPTAPTLPTLTTPSTPSGAPVLGSAGTAVGPGLAGGQGPGQVPSPGEPPSPTGATAGERWYKNRNGLVATLPNLPPGIQPVSGHNVSAGWL